ncbi:MAG: Copper transport protein [Chloroflexi bacterium]|jgi:methionine-rich copper-binding protein CopC|nr:Copper transport protein [Chloroflexota bacterium]
MRIVRRGLRLRALLALLIALAGALASQLPVSARTSLLASDPPNGAALSRSPSRVSLDFDRDVSAALAAVRLVDAEGRAHPLDGVSVDPARPTRLVVALPGLPRDTYRLGVRLRDRVDLEVTEMSAVFAVASTPTLATAPASYHGGAPAGVVLAWLGLLGLSVVTGALVLVLAVVPAALSGGRAHTVVRCRLCAAAVGGAAVALAAQPLGLAAHALDLGGGAAGLRTLLGDGAYATRWIATTAMLAALPAPLLVLWRRARRGQAPWPPALLPLPAVEALAVALTVAATIGVATGAVTGGDASPGLAGSALRSAQLLATGVGVGGIIGLGVALGAVRAGSTGTPHRRVRSLIAGFAPWFAGATVVLVVSGLLLAGAQPPAVAAAPARMTTVAADGLDISFSLSPNRPGRNLVTVDVLSVEHPALAPVRGVTLRLLRPGDSTPRQIVAAPTLHPDVFDGGAIELRDPGDLEVGVVVSRAGVPALRADLTWTVGAGRPPAQPPAVSGRQLAPVTTTAALLIVAGTGAILHLLGRRRRAAEERASRPGRRAAGGTTTPRDSR